MIKFKEILKSIAEYKILLQGLGLSFQVILAVISFLFYQAMFPITIAVQVYAVLIFLFLKNRGEEKKALLQYRLYLFTLFLGLWEMLNSMIVVTGIKFLRVISAIALLTLMIMATAYCFGSKNKTRISDYMAKDILKELSGDKPEPGDLVMGVDMETQKPVVWPYHDRFVHMIIYGGTGTGKTSQFFLPMINQDIKNPDVAIIVLEPKGDLTIQVYAMAKLENRKVTYFDPYRSDCPYFNPLYGDPSDVEENISSAFGAMDSTDKTYFRDTNDLLLRNSVKVVKRLYGNKATLQDLQSLMSDSGGDGSRMIAELQKMKFDNKQIDDENKKLAYYFRNDYYSGLKGERGASNTYRDSSGVRNQVSKLCANKYVSRVLNPPKDKDIPPEKMLNFERVMANKEVLCLCSQQKLRDMGSYVGYFLMLTLESYILARPGNENTRSGVALYIDEFQKYANPGFEDILTQGRSYRVSCVMATQNRAFVAGDGSKKGVRFQRAVDSNARSMVLLPGASAEDAKYFKDTFGTHIVTKTKTTESSRSYLPKFMTWEDARESIATSEEEEAIFNESSLIYGQFTEAVCRLIVHNSVDQPRRIKVKFLDRDRKDNIDEMVEELTHGQDDFRSTEALEKSEEYIDSSSSASPDVYSDEFDIGSNAGENSDEEFDLSGEKKDSALPDSDAKKESEGGAGKTPYEKKDSGVDEIPIVDSVK